MDLQSVLNEAIEYARQNMEGGKVASYIPELAKENPENLGAYIALADGRTYAAGDWEHEFTIQSISKTITLLMTLDKVGEDVVFSKVGVEATGDAFNSIVKLETKTSNPLNPMINAGAIAMSSVLVGAGFTFDDYLKVVRKFCGRENIELNERVYLSEKSEGNRNRAMAYLMQNDRVLDCCAEEACDFYFKTCSVNVNSKDLANYALVLANNGTNPITGEKLFRRRFSRIAKTLMITCGMYDASGAFALNIGMPAKSGVGGGIMTTLEKKAGLAAYSPGLDSAGNSIGAYQVLWYLSNKLNLHMFAGDDCLIETKAKDMSISQYINRVL